MEPKKNIHSGHRERLRKNVETTGIYNLSDIHFLEYLLTFVIPRKDTNPIAHELLDEFKTIDNIFGATKKALCNVNGVGEKTALFLQFMSSVCYYNDLAQARRNPFAGTLKSAIEFINKVLPPSQNEQFIVLILNKNLTVKNYKIFNGISHSYVNFDLKVFSEYLVSHQTSFCLLAHTHPHHNANPSNSDYATFWSFKPIFQSLSVVVLDNLILGENEFCSFRNEMIRKYDEMSIDFVANKNYPLTSFDFNKTLHFTRG